MWQNTSETKMTNMSEITERPTNFLFFILYPAHAAAISGLIACSVLGLFNWLDLLYFLVGWVFIYGIGVHTVLHRLVSHRAFEPRKYLSPLLLWLASMSLQGSPLWWAALHRGSHHRYCDTERDTHSPINGIWYAWHGWIYHWPKYFNPRNVVDLVKDPLHVFFADHYSKIILITYLVVGLISWKILLFGFLLPAAIGLYQENFINVLCHIRRFGYRNFDTQDNSTNITLLAWTNWGQGWHNNHHQLASSYDFGTSVSGKSSEFDPSLLLLPLIATKSSREKIFTARREKTLVS
jgi:sn-1 stearoyl-lipid 9-desaturase